MRLSPNFLTDDTPFSASSFPHSLSIEGELTAAAAIGPVWKRELYFLLENPRSSQAAFIVHGATVFLIIVSAAVTVLETVPAFRSISVRVWFGWETGLVVLFTVEYVLRCLAWSSAWRNLFGWTFSFFGMIDLLAVLPYYLELLLEGDTTELFRFSILRMFRLLRIFRPFRYNNTILLTIEVMYLSVRRSQHALFAMGFFGVMVLTIFSTLLYFTERGVWDEKLGAFINSEGDPTDFSSIPAAAWFVIVTITTVGYGDMTPRSFLGRLLTLPILIFGLLFITLPSFVLGREFSVAWNMMTHVRKTRGDRLDDVSLLGPEEHLISDDSTPHTPARDLTNLKLALNQTELSRQIEDLTASVNRQGQLLNQYLEILDAASSDLLVNSKLSGTRRIHASS